MKHKTISLLIALAMVACACVVNKLASSPEGKSEISNNCYWLDETSFQVPNLSSAILSSSSLRDTIYIKGKLKREPTDLRMAMQNLQFVKRPILEDRDLDTLLAALQSWRFRECGNLGDYDVRLELGFGNALRGEFPHCSTYWNLLRVEISSPNREPVSVQRYWIVDTTTIERIAK